MKTAIRYYSRSGNTKKLAESVGNAVSVEPKEVSEPLTEKVDVLFLGCSYYAFDMDEAVKTFICENHGYIGKIVCFGTSAMMKSMKKPLKKVCDPYGVVIAEEEFHCRGQFGKLHKGRPDATDMEAIYHFAKKIITE